jgi:hypothetical protein
MKKWETNNTAQQEAPPCFAAGRRALAARKIDSIVVRILLD